MSLLRDGGAVERQGIAPDSPWWTVHIARYRYALPFARGRRVLDIACGTGYGLSELRRGAHTVVGVDVDTGAAETARKQVDAPVFVSDGRELPFRDRSFDVVVSFETIEHFEHRDRFVRELARVLTESGVLVLSTPNANHTKPIDGKPHNPFHVHEYTPHELDEELGKHFDSVQLMGQVLDSRFLVPPLSDEQAVIAAAGRRSSVLAWRTLAKLPLALGNAGSHWLWRQPLFPSVEDYDFERSRVDDAPVLVAVCRRSSA